MKNFPGLYQLYFLSDSSCMQIPTRVQGNDDNPAEAQKHIWLCIQTLSQVSNDLDLTHKLTERVPSQEAVWHEERCQKLLCDP